MHAPDQFEEKSEDIVRFMMQDVVYRNVERVRGRLLSIVYRQLTTDVG